MPKADTRSIANEPLRFPAFAESGRHPALTTVAMAATDAVCLTFAWSLALLLSRLAGHSLSDDAWLRSLAVLPVTIIVLAASGLYPARGIDSLAETKRVTMCITLVQLGCMFSFWIAKAGAYQLRTLGLWAISIVLVPWGRSLIRRWLSNKAWWGEPVLLIGSGAPLAELHRLLTRFPRLGLHAVGLLNEVGSLNVTTSHLPAFQDLQTGLLFAGQQRIRTAVVALGGPGSLSVSEAASRYGAYFPKLILVPPMSPRFNLCSRAGTLGGYISIQVSQKLLMPFSTIAKRWLDLAIAVPTCLALLPFMLVIAAAVKLTSPGPVFFGHRRIGKKDAPFRAWKFRTMVSDADTLLAERLATSPALRIEWERDHKLRDDPRVTPIGSLLRKYSLDELPQLWNVIRAEMSIVGPRPISSAEISKYAEHFSDYSRVLPGITGLWQVSGRNETTYQERVQFDTYYVNNWSPWLDLYIIFRTFKVVFSARGAY